MWQCLRGWFKLPTSRLYTRSTCAMRWCRHLFFTCRSLAARNLTARKSGWNRQFMTASSSFLAYLVCRAHAQIGMDVRISREIWFFPIRECIVSEWKKKNWKINKNDNAALKKGHLTFQALVKCERIINHLIFPQLVGGATK